MEFMIGSIEFSGPLDLLLELIKANKYDIKDIFIKNIIQQYCEIVENAVIRESELASDFLIMASSLLQIKSRYFLHLSNPKDEISPASELIELLEEYNKYRELSTLLKNFYDKSEVIYYKKPTEILEESYLDFSGKKPEDLFQCICEINRVMPVSESKIISYKKISVQTKIEIIETALMNRAKLYFSSFINPEVRDDVVAGLLGILELAKIQKVSLIQEDIFDNIMIERSQYEY